MKRRNSHRFEYYMFLQNLEFYIFTSFPLPTSVDFVLLMNRIQITEKNNTFSLFHFFLVDVKIVYNLAVKTIVFRLIVTIF